ncbi:hypothetical protein AMECASPLE_001525 [Ameca splendens]|uniref:Secreted protein n=1 Tax=Ameca splendens TaxID=208324 RepID=A0ABV0YXC8_9TELE
MNRTAGIFRPFSTIFRFYLTMSRGALTSPVPSVAVELLYCGMPPNKTRDITERSHQRSQQTQSSQRQRGQAVATLTFLRVKTWLTGGGEGIDRIPLVKCALRIPEI